MNSRERQAAINQDLREFVSLSRRTNCMPIKLNTLPKHDVWVYRLAREDVDGGYDVIVNGRLTGGRGFPDVARLGEGHRIVEVLGTETLSQAKLKVLKYPNWPVEFFSVEKETFL